MAQKLGVFEGKILRKIWKPLHVALYGYKGMAQRINIQRLCWLGHVVRMDTNAPALKVFDAVPADGSRGRGRPPLRWKDQVGKDLASPGVSNWNRLARLVKIGQNRVSGYGANQEEE